MEDTRGVRPTFTIWLEKWRTRRRRPRISAEKPIDRTAKNALFVQSPCDELTSARFPLNLFSLKRILFREHVGHMASSCSIRMCELNLFPSLRLSSYCRTATGRRRTFIVDSACVKKGSQDLGQRAARRGMPSGTVSHPHRRLPAEIRERASLTLLPAEKF